MRTFRAAATTAILVATAFTAFPAAAQFGGIHVAANRHEYIGRGCPVEVIFTGSINLEMPHPKGFVFNYHWERSDGAKSAVKVVHPAPGERTVVVRENWRVGARGSSHDVSAVLHVNSGNTHLTEGSPTVHVECR
jgi:hypothetical protein